MTIRSAEGQQKSQHRSIGNQGIISRIISIRAIVQRTLFVYARASL